MDSVREKIFGAVKTKTEVIDGIGQVSRGKIDPLSINRYPALFILPGFDQVNEYLGEFIDRELQLFLFLWFHVELDIHKAIEAFLPKVQQTMAADHTLGGLTKDLTESAIDQPFPLSDDQNDAGVMIDYRVIYRVRRTDPYSQS